MTFKLSEDINYLLQRWPWDGSPIISGENNSAGQDHTDAIRFGFRTASKSRWERLNSEYLAYRQRLLDDIASVQLQEPVDMEAENREVPSTAVTDVPEPEFGDNQLEHLSLDLSAPFPPGCLVFVRNVHPETNKTTLRKLFSHAFDQAKSGAASDEVDYVDFTKGMNTVSSL